jgi:glycerophosphoryl diester phosphodiesterase
MLVVGHRGARYMAPENTVMSIKKALELGADGVEFDVRVTQDNVPVLHHNPEIADASGQMRFIGHHKFAELKEHKSDLATLDQALALFGKDDLVFMEVKPGQRIQPIASVLSKHLSHLDKDKIYIMSFSLETLLELKMAFPGIKLVVNEQWSGVRANFKASRVGTRYISMGHLWLWSGFIKATRRRHTLFTYGLNSPKKARRWAKYGLKGVITDYPDRFTPHS